MVQPFQARSLARRATLVAACVLLLVAAMAALGRKDKPSQVLMPPDLLLEGDRKLTFVQSFSSERETRGKLGFWNKMLDVVAGEPEYHRVKAFTSLTSPSTNISSWTATTRIRAR
jgi:hypothetical protein